MKCSLCSYMPSFWVESPDTGKTEKGQLKSDAEMPKVDLASALYRISKAKKGKRVYVYKYPGCYCVRELPGDIRYVVY